VRRLRIKLLGGYAVLDDGVGEVALPARKAQALLAYLALSPGQWHGPVLSGYGVHLVFVHSVSEPPPVVLEAVHERVVRDWKDDRRESINEAFYANLRDRYNIVIEKPKGDNQRAARQGAGH